MKNKQTTKRLFAALAVVVVLCALAWGYFALKKAGLLSMLSSPEALRDWVEGFGVWGPAVFFLVQFSQVIVAPIPGSATALAGGLLFGFWKGMLISVSAMLLGSAVAFLLARRLGRPFVRFLVGQAVMDKYVDALGGRSMGVLFMMFFLPFFPDDALCFISGLTAIPLPFFLLAVAVTRPAGLIFSSLVGAGVITIPVWGWVIIGLASLGFLWASWKYGDALNQKMLAWLARQEKRRTKG